MNSDKRKDIIIIILAILVLASFILFILSIKKDYYHFREKLAKDGSNNHNKLAVLNTKIYRWLVEWNLTRNCYHELYGDRSLFENYCQKYGSNEPILFRRQKSCHKQTTASDLTKSPMLFDKNGPIAMEKKFWLKFYIERLPLWRARRFREWKLAKTWATKHGLQCIINDNSNKINDDDNHKLIHSYNHNENEMNQNADIN